MVNLGWFKSRFWSFWTVFLGRLWSVKVAFWFVAACFESAWVSLGLFFGVLNCFESSWLVLGCFALA